MDITEPNMPRFLVRDTKTGEAVLRSNSIALYRDVPDVVEYEGCRSLFICRLQQKKQLQCALRIADGLAAGYQSEALRDYIRCSFPKLISRRDSPLRIQAASDFWSSVQSWKKKIENTNLGACRRFLKNSKKKDCKKSRYSLQFSLSLIGKSLRSPCQCFGALNSQASAHKEKISRPDEVSPEFLGFVKEMAGKFFYKGWDNGYENAAVGCSVPSKACYEKGQRFYGSMKEDIGLGGQQDFLRRVLGEKEVDIDNIGRFSEVLSAGKIRPLTIMHSSYNYLRPLHKTLYNFISRFPWLLRGPPRSDRVTFSEDPGFYVSVDFEAATDNLSVNCAEVILGAALKESGLSDDMKKIAMKALRPKVEYEAGREPVELTSGQMMGSLLSFPLMCLQTFFFYLFATGQTSLSGSQLRRFDRCLVNGDDLVFKTENPDDFFSAVASTPMIVNRKKTHVSREFLNVNSTLFQTQRGVTRSIPFLRPAQLDIELPEDLGSKVFEITRWLSADDLGRATFEWAMKRSVYVAKSYGWSFFKCGFFGSKQGDWLARRHPSYEVLVRRSRLESEIPHGPETGLETRTVPCSDELASAFDPEQLASLSRVFHAWSSFYSGLPIEKPSWCKEREFLADRFDWKSFRAAEDHRWSRFGPKFGMLGYKGSRYPAWHHDKLFRYSRNAVTYFFGDIKNHAAKKQKQKKKYERGNIPKELSDFMMRAKRNDPGLCPYSVGGQGTRKRYPGPTLSTGKISVHPSVLNSIKKILFDFKKYKRTLT